MAEKQITVDPTVSTSESMYVPENGDLSPAYAPYAGTMPPATERGFLTGGFAVPKDLTRADYRASFHKLLELTAALHRAPVAIVAGTDGSGLESRARVGIICRSRVDSGESAANCYDQPCPPGECGRLNRFHHGWQEGGSCASGWRSFQPHWRSAPYRMGTVRRQAYECRRTASGSGVHRPAALSSNSRRC